MLCYLFFYGIAVAKECTLLVNIEDSTTANTNKRDKAVYDRQLLGAKHILDIIDTTSFDNYTYPGKLHQMDRLMRWNCSYYYFGHD